MKTLFLLLSLVSHIHGQNGTNGFVVNELNCLSKNVYYESRGLDVNEQRAVAYVTLNRLKDARYPKTVCDIVYQKKIVNGEQVAQFSWTVELGHEVTDYNAWSRSVDVALDTYTDKVEDPTNGATHFYSRKMLKKPPYWTKAAYDVVKLPGQSYMKIATSY